ncbi:MAG: DUF5696 domain-containing protein [Pirellulales bacterium]
MRWNLEVSRISDGVRLFRFKTWGLAASLGLAAVLSVAGWARADTRVLESPAMRVAIDPQTGDWSMVDKASGVRWPSEGTASAGSATGLEGAFDKEAVTERLVRVEKVDGAAVIFELIDEGRSLEIRYEGETVGDVRVLGDALAVTATEEGYAVVPCREGLLFPATSGVAFSRTFGTSDYEGCHMNMIGLVKRGTAMVVSWDDAYVFAELKSTLPSGENGSQRLTVGFHLRRTARTVRLTPLGKGDWNTLAAGYRRVAERRGLAVTLREKIERNPRAELLIGAADFKLWTCLARRMNEESTEEESVRVRWSFDEAAAIAEHLHHDVGIRRCLFMIGGWTEGGYDCRHPDNLPANPECGGNDALADAIRRIQELGFVACLHDNYQDMYRDAASWDPAVIEKKPDGSLIQGGRWLGGRAYMVCAPKQVEMAMRPQNLPEIQRLFAPWSYFIDTTFAVGPRECSDPNHRLGRNEDIAWKSRLSDEARKRFGIFGSECGREWALAHSEFFEGLVGVSGRYFHNLDPAKLGATVIPFWEMVYHDCQICWGKYGYSADEAAPFVAHHALCARPLYYHSVPDHLYWTGEAAGASDNDKPSGDRASYARTDQGWADGMHPLDAFVKTTQELLGPLHAATAYDRLSLFEFLTPDRSIRRAQYGEGDLATTVVANFGAGDATVTTELGGMVRLPPWGLAIEGPRFAAFYAKQWGGRSYPSGALFTVQVVEGECLGEASKLRVFHGFGDPVLTWKGVDYEVAREQVITPGG